MREGAQWARRWVRSLAIIIFGLNALAIGAGGAPWASSRAVAQAGSRSTGTLALSKTDSERLARYTANGEPLVVLAIAAREGENAAVALAVEKYGGRVDYRLDTIDYLAAVLPTAAVSNFLAEPGLQSIAIDNMSEEPASFRQSLSVFKSRFDAASLPAAPRVAGKPILDDASRSRSPRLPARPFDDPYLILRDMDGEAFRQRDVRFDGRGVVIAHVEDFPDFLSPELQLAKSASGDAKPKFADIINIPAPSLSLDPDAPRRGDRWTTRLSPPVSSRGSLLRFGGQRYRLPKAGTYRLAKFALPSDSFGTYVYPHVREWHASSNSLRDGEPLVLDVLWSDAEKRLWIDSDGDGDFSDEQGIADFKLSHEFGVFGKDDPTTEIRESAAYSVQADGDYIGVNLAYSGHATFVAGAAAASRGRGLIEGIAPGAQLLSINGHGREASIAAYVRALATAYIDERVDIVLVQGHAQIQAAHGRTDAQSLPAVVNSRLVKRYRKPTLSTAGNGFSMSSIADLTVPDNVLSIGASQSRASLFSYYGLKTRHSQDLHWVGSEGPSADGALKPDLLAPANPLAPSSKNQDAPIYPGVFRLPVGYEICGGTSCAAPVAAGAAALLVGAAKLEGLPHDAEAIHSALRNTAQFISHVPAYKQGRGVLQVDAAWRYLVSRAATQGYEVEIATFAGERGGDELSRPARGLFERDGWSAGMQQSRVIQVTRRTGPADPVSFSVTWEGNNGAFTSKDSISLPLDTPVPLTIGITAGTAGAYSAIAHLAHPSQPGPTVSIPVTIVVPNEFSQENAFSWNGKATLDRPGRSSLFFRVPQGVNALEVKMTVPREGIVWALIPPGDPDAPHGTKTTAMTDKSEVLIETPVAGVWEAALLDLQDSNEFDWLAADREYLPSTAIEVAARIIGASATIQDQNVKVENRFAAFEGRITTQELGGIRCIHAATQPYQPLVFDIQVEQGQPILAAGIERLGGANLDADLHLFDCTDGTCVISRRSEKPGTSERVVVERPNPGNWRAVVLTSGRGGEMRIAYTDFYTHPKLGALATTDALQAREVGAAWQTEFNIWRLGEPREGYKPAGLIRILDEKNLQGQQIDQHMPSSIAASVRWADIMMQPFLLEGGHSNDVCH